MSEIVVSDGKYTFYMKEHTLYCDRYGETWREFLGDNAVTSLFNKCLELQNAMRGIYTLSSDSLEDKN